MLQITEYNISLKLGLQNEHRPLITTERAWASSNAGSKLSFTPFRKLGLRTKNL